MEPEEPLNEDEHHRPIYIQYSLRNGLYIRPNSPINNEEVIPEQMPNGTTVNTQNILPRIVH